LRIQVSQGSAATDLRWGGPFNTIFLSSRSENAIVKELLKLSTFAKVIAKIKMAPFLLRNNVVTCYCMNDVCKHRNTMT